MNARSQDTQEFIDQEVARKTSQLRSQMQTQREELLDIIKELESVTVSQRATINQMCAEAHYYGTVLYLQDKPDLSSFQYQDTVVVIDPKSNLYGQSGKIVSNNPVISEDGEVLVEIMNKDETTAPFSIGLLNPPEIRLAAKSDGRFAVINIDGKPWEVQHPLDGRIAIGDTVKVYERTKQISGVDLAAIPELSGPVVRVSSITPMGIEVEDKGEKKLIQNPKKLAIKSNDKIVLDHGSSIAIAILPKDASQRYKIATNLDVSWDSIGGLAEAKQQCRDTIELPFVKAELFTFYKIKKSKGAILYGPPGCGKTLIGQACAASLARTHNKNVSESGLIYVKGPELLSKWVGETEADVRDLFERGRNHYREHGYPAIVIMDEADALIPQRGTRRSSDISDTIVPMFLGEMDGVDVEQTKMNPIVFALTNRVDTLDPAFVRRFSVKINVGRPNLEAALDILRIQTSELPFQREENREMTLMVITQDIFSKTRLLYRINNEHEFCFSDVINGSMISDIVACAKLIALHEDDQAGTQTGVSLEHLRKAIHRIYAEQQGLNHSYDLWDFADKHGIQHQDLKFERCFGAAT